MSTPDDFGFKPIAKIGADAEPQDIFQELLQGTEDGERPAPLSDEDLGTLEEEWQRLVDARERADRTRQIADEANTEYVLARERMARAMSMQGTTQFRGSNGGSCVVTEVYTTTVEDPDAWLDYVKESHPELLTVHSGARTKFIRENYRDRGIPETDPDFPPGLKAGTIERLQVRDARRANNEET